MNVNLISNAYASAAGGNSGGQGHPPGSGMGSLLILIIVFLIISYFMIWRPQSRRAKEHRNLIDNLSKGDEVSTNGGILGKIVKIDNQYAVLNIADNIEIIIQKAAITTLLPKGTIKSI